jgi:hypothetical protein
MRKLNASSFLTYSEAGRVPVTPRGRQDCRWQSTLAVRVRLWVGLRRGCFGFAYDLMVDD